MIEEATGMTVDGPTSYVVIVGRGVVFFFFSSRRRHTRLQGDWSSDVCSSDLRRDMPAGVSGIEARRAGLLAANPQILQPRNGLTLKRGRAIGGKFGDDPGMGEIGRASCRERV